MNASSSEISWLHLQNPGEALAKNITQKLVILYEKISAEIKIYIINMS